MSTCRLSYQCQTHCDLLLLLRPRIPQSQYTSSFENLWKTEFNRYHSWARIRLSEGFGNLAPKTKQGLEPLLMCINAHGEAPVKDKPCVTWGQALSAEYWDSNRHNFTLSCDCHPSPNMFFQTIPTEKGLVTFVLWEPLASLRSELKKGFCYSCIVVGEVFTFVTHIHNLSKDDSINLIFGASKHDKRRDLQLR
jgi:hypothetical protein